jgi:hypothetical protein
MLGSFKQTTTGNQQQGPILYFGSRSVEDQYKFKKTVFINSIAKSKDSFPKKLGKI